MIQRVETVAYGRPATEALQRVITDAKATGPLVPVTVLVGSNFVGLSLRRLLASGELGGRGLANVQFVTPFQVAELLVPDRLGGRRPLTNPILGAAVRQALVADPGPFAEVVRHPATQSAITALYAELSRVSPSTLDRLAACGGAAVHSVQIFRNVASRLGGFYGESDQADAVAGRVDLAQEADRLGHLVWFLPQPVTAPLERMLAALTGALDATAVVGLTGSKTADQAVVELCGRLGIEVDAAAAGAVPTAAQIISAPDPDDEVRSVVRSVMALAESGVRLDRIGIFYPASDPYVQTLQHLLNEADLPANGPSRDQLADTVAGRTLLSALALPDQRWRRDKVMALIAAAPVRNGDQPVFPTSWELLSRNAGVVQGLDDWRRKLDRHRSSRVERIERAVADGHDAQVARLEDDCRDLGALGDFIEQLALMVAGVQHASGWKHKASATADLLGHLLGAERRRLAWPDSEQDAADKVSEALDRLATLDELDPDPTHDVFVRALTSELDVGRSRVGRFGHGVVYGPLSTAPGQDLDAVFLLGMAEGLCPAPRRDDSLLPDSARAVASPGELPLRAAHLDGQHREVLAALATAPPERRVLSFPRGSLRRSGARLPSRWMLDTASHLAGRRVFSTDFSTLGPPVVQVIASYADGLRSAVTPLSLIERDQCDLTTAMASGVDPVNHHAAGGSVGRGIAALHARRSSSFTEWDGNLAGAAIPSPTRHESPLSPTGLEQWASCGFRYFLDHVIGVRDRDDPERIHELSALDRGSGVHAALERFFAWVIAEGAPDPDTKWTDEQRQRLRGIADEVLDELEATGRTGRAVGWQIERARLVTLLDDFLSEDERRRAEWRSRPVSVELPFGLDNADPVVVSLGDGRGVHFRGKADRVDRTDDGGWVVLDYKTGQGKPYRKLHLDEFLGGTTLQLGLYAEAARRHLGEGRASAYYWMVDDKAKFLPMGYEWTPELRARFVDLLESMVDGIEAGVFPMAPGNFDSFANTYVACRFCDFDDVCPGDRGAYADAKVAAPELQVRSKLVPVDADDDMGDDE